MLRTNKTGFYAAGILHFDERHAECDRHDGAVCGCGGCTCHHTHPAGARVLLVEHPGLSERHGIVVRAEPLVLTVEHADGARQLYAWDARRGRYHGMDGAEFVIRPACVVLGPAAAPAEEPAGDLHVEVSAPRALGSGWVVAVTASSGSRRLREELVPTYLGPGATIMPPKAALLAEVILRVERVGLRLLRNAS